MLIDFIFFFIILSLLFISSFSNMYTNSFLVLILCNSSFILSNAISSMFTKSDNSFSFCSVCKLNLSINLWKFSSLNFSNSFELSHSCIFKSSIFSCKGTSVFIVPKVLERSAKSLFSTNFSLILGFSVSVPSSTDLYKLSIDLYCLIMSSAVFSPTPGTPGMLSDVSPISPFTSISSFGSIPYFSLISSSPKVSTSVFPTFVCGILIEIFEDANWNVSLSPDTIVTSNPAFSPSFAKVPNISSPS